jgi:hypothetical protein
MSVSAKKPLAQRPRVPTAVNDVPTGYENDGENVNFELVQITALDVARRSVPWKYVLRQSHLDRSGRDCPRAHSR